MYVGLDTLYEFQDDIKKHGIVRMQETERTK